MIFLILGRENLSNQILQLVQSLAVRSEEREAFELSGPTLNSESKAEYKYSGLGFIVFTSTPAFGPTCRKEAKESLVAVAL